MQLITTFLVFLFCQFSLANEVAQFSSGEEFDSKNQCFRIATSMEQMTNVVSSEVVVAISKKLSLSNSEAIYTLLENKSDGSSCRILKNPEKRVIWSLGGVQRLATCTCNIVLNY